MQIQRTHQAAPTTDGKPPTYANTETHWWDASQVYGSSLEFQHQLRTHAGGKLLLSPEGNVPFDPSTMRELAGVNGNWWLGLAMFHTVFMREHNAICDRLARAHPDWDDDELFEHARLVNAALIAKIHTVEWTTALLGSSTMQTGMRANWWGLMGERFARRFGRREHERGGQRHPGLADVAPRRSLRHDGGVRRRLPHAPAHPGRLLAAGRRRQPRDRQPHVPRDRRHEDPRDPRHGADGGSPLLVRHRAPRRHRAPQLPEAPAALPQARRQCGRSRRRRPPAQPGAGRSPVQRVPPPVPPRAGPPVRGLQRRSLGGRRPAPPVRRARGRGSHDRPVRRGAAEGLRRSATPPSGCSS